MTNPNVSERRWPRSKSVVFYSVGIGLVLAGTAFAVEVGARQARRLASARAELDEEARRGPVAQAVKVTTAPSERTLSLLGDVEPFMKATIYAKLSGYLREVRFDKGDQVQKGDVLGIVESPEADQGVAAATADLGVKAETERRYQDLIKGGIVSGLELDRAVGNLRVATADRLRAESARDYAVIRAPFSGTVTARYADPGALLQAATTSAQSALPLLELADLSRIRVQIYVGAYDAPFVRVGDAATVWTDASPNDRKNAKIARITHAMDSRTRTMLCELDLDNADGHLYAGMSIHAMVQLRERPSIAIPSEAVVLRQGETVVAVVLHDRVRFIRVSIDSDDGTKAYVGDGLRDGDVVLSRITDDIVQDGPVRPAFPSPSSAGH